VRRTFDELWGYKITTDLEIQDEDLITRLRSVLSQCGNQ
jgi:hypothetical protein